MNLRSMESLSKIVSWFLRFLSSLKGSNSTKLLNGEGEITVSGIENTRNKKKGVIR
jgi:hypothetical protein